MDGIVSEDYEKGHKDFREDFEALHHPEADEKDQLLRGGGHHQKAGRGKEISAATSPTTNSEKGTESSTDLGLKLARSNTNMGHSDRTEAVSATPADQKIGRGKAQIVALC